MLEGGEEPYWVTRDQYLWTLDAVADDPRVRISFDDGNASDIELGLPALLDRGLTATYFVLAGRLDQSGSLSGDDVRALAAQGMRIGTHGLTHRPWETLTGQERRCELEEARDILASVSGQPVDAAALPLGRYDRRLLGELRRLGYHSVHTSDRRWAQEGHWLQPRFSMRGQDTTDWLRRHVLSPQPLRRRVGRAAVCTAKRWR